MTDATISTLPTDINFDLDTVTRDEKDTKPPFKAQLEGRIIQLKDPSTLDWRDIIAMKNPSDLIRISLSREDREYLQSKGFETWKFGKLLEAYSYHFELEKLIEDAQRQGALSGYGL